VILPALHSDYNKLFRVPRFELPQLREYMDAVNSTVGPEVEDHDLPPEVSKL
jgi:hypothetical protein